jgi:hypothetical protein
MGVTEVLLVTPCSFPTPLFSGSIRKLDRSGTPPLAAPETEWFDFSAIHKTGRCYFPGVIGIDILRHSVLHILPRESMPCIEKGGS